MNSNTATATVTTRNAVNTTTTAPEVVPTLPKVIEAMLDLIDRSARYMTIAEAEKVMHSLRDLDCSIMDMIWSRIPQDSLSKVEGKWYLTATAEEGNVEAAASKYREILSASPLAALEGYASQILTETKLEEKRQAALVADPFDGIADAEDERELADTKTRREALSVALEEIREAITTHGGEAIANTVGLHPATFDSLFSIV